MKDLIIIGASGMGRETFNMAVGCEGYNKEWRIKGFLDDNINAIDGYPGYPAIIGSIKNYCVEENDIFACAIGSVFLRKNIVEKIKSRGGNFINLLHPMATIFQNLKCGVGIIIYPNAGISNDITMSDHVTIQSNAILGHDCYVGSYVQIGAHSFLGGEVSLGDNVTIHPGCTILPGINISEGSIIGAGSVVIRNVPPNCTIFGVPGTRL